MTLCKVLPTGACFIFSEHGTKVQLLGRFVLTNVLPVRMV